MRGLLADKLALQQQNSELSSKVAEQATTIAELNAKIIELGEVDAVEDAEYEAKIAEYKDLAEKSQQALAALTEEKATAEAELNAALADIQELLE